MPRHNTIKLQNNKEDLKSSLKENTDYLQGKDQELASQQQ